MNLPQKQTDDRRGSDRRSLRASVLLKLPTGHVIEARALDIGKGGTGVVCDFNVAVGTEVAIRMALPVNPSGGTVFEATAKVTNCTLSSKDGGFRLGLQFNALSAAASAALTKHLA